MRFKTDENLHGDVTRLFVAAGHDVHSVFEEGLRGAPDDAIAARYAVESRVLITLDLDYADIRTYPPASHPGTIVLRVGSQSRTHVLKVLSQVLTLLEQMPIANRLWIVSESGVRIRE